MNANVTRDSRLYTHTHSILFSLGPNGEGGEGRELTFLKLLLKAQFTLALATHELVTREMIHISLMDLGVGGEVSKKKFTFCFSFY